MVLVLNLMLTTAVVVVTLLPIPFTAALVPCICLQVLGGVRVESGVVCPCGCTFVSHAGWQVLQGEVAVAEL